MPVTFYTLLAILVFQVLFAIAAAKENGKLFQVMYYLNYPFLLLNILTISTFF